MRTAYHALETERRLRSERRDPAHSPRTSDIIKLLALAVQLHKKPIHTMRVTIYLLFTKKKLPPLVADSSTLLKDASRLALQYTGTNEVRLSLGTLLVKFENNPLVSLTERSARSSISRAKFADVAPAALRL